MMKRLTYNLIIFLCIAAAPWWIAVGMMVAGIFIFSYYVESLVLAFVFDMMYGVPGVVIGNSMFMVSISVATIFMVSGIIKGRLRVYEA